MREREHSLIFQLNLPILVVQSQGCDLLKCFSLVILPPDHHYFLTWLQHLQSYFCSPDSSWLCFLFCVVLLFPLGVTRRLEETRMGDIPFFQLGYDFRIALCQGPFLWRIDLLVLNAEGSSLISQRLYFPSLHQSNAGIFLRSLKGEPAGATGGKAHESENTCLRL